MPALYFRLSVIARFMEVWARFEDSIWINVNESCIVIIDLLCNTLLGWFKFPLL